MKHLFLILAGIAVTAEAFAARPADGVHRIQVLTTNDIHGRYMDAMYVGGDTSSSLLTVSEYVKDYRNKYGEDNVILIDAGDCLQGDNAAYYYNYIDTKSKHIYARMAEMLGYDAVVVGNHDIETGHAVYDRIRRTMKVPFLAANAVKTRNGKPYFKEYVILKRGGVRIAVIGFTNANIKGWLAPEIWEGMTFESLVPFVQNTVDKVVRKEKPDAVIVAVHSGTGPGDGSELESQGRDLLYSLKGVDLLVCSHDHKAYTEARSDGTAVLINGGSHCNGLGHGVLEITTKDGDVTGKKVHGDLIALDKSRVDTRMREKFRKEYEAVREFTCREVGELAMHMKTRDAYRGMADYINLIHTVCLGVKEADLSMAAPLTYNGYISQGRLIYNDMFTIYPFENQLFVVRMSGQEIKDYLEYSYDGWINTVSVDKEGKIVDDVLKIEPVERQEGGRSWSFVGRSYNFDSLGGAVYTVDVTKPKGERVSITAMADGTEFLPDKEYNVAMTSYRASGGGFIISEGAGIKPSEMDGRTVARYPEIREMLYRYISGRGPEAGPITPEEVGRHEVVGKWRFIAEAAAEGEVEAAIGRGMHKLFPKYE